MRTSKKDKGSAYAPRGHAVSSLLQLTCGLGTFLLLSMTMVTAQETRQEADRINTQVVQLFQEGKYEEAIPLAERAVKIRTRLLDDDDPDTAEHLTDLAASLVNLATLYRSTGRFEKAEPLLLRAVELKKRVSGADLDNSQLSTFRLHLPALQMV